MKNINQRGVSLIEVLISILVIAVGVLGIAKMQALTISGAATSGSRGLIAMQASSLAAVMHSNTAYWQVTSPASPNCFGATSCKLSGGSSSGTAFGTAAALTSCTYAAPCSAPAIAAIDVNTWMASMNSLIPSYTASINCSNSATLPTSCIITINWYEKQQGMNNTTASASTNASNASQTYVLYVQP